ncbi:hypothetical protein BJB45_13220 [Halomonas huangheensis]|uniref:Uncharacterized protein n=1 Tax=Halomonas huangheensis TaxID=1178482 RepID=W1N8S8_9GAMM|nr:hypothetical protein BJB45_13220 [Halomonas huangheensis]
MFLLAEASTGIAQQGGILRGDDDIYAGLTAGIKIGEGQ